MPALRRVGGRIKRVGERVISPLERLLRRVPPKEKKEIEEWSEKLIREELGPEELGRFGSMDPEKRSAILLRAVEKLEKDKDYKKLARNLRKYYSDPEFALLGEKLISLSKAQRWYTAALPQLVTLLGYIYYLREHSQGSTPSATSMIPALVLAGTSFFTVYKGAKWEEISKKMEKLREML